MEEKCTTLSTCIGLLVSGIKVNNMGMAGLRGGPARILLGAPKGWYEITGINGNMVLINSGFHT
jgi:hypothetical protein